MLLKSILPTLALTLAITSAQAHEMWLERGENGTVRAYLGDVAGQPDTGEDVAKLVDKVRFHTGSKIAEPAVVAHEDHLAATLDHQGDVRLYTDQVWAPWQRDDGSYKAAAFQARTGRTETKAIFDLELVPVAAGSDTVTLLFKGAPLPATDVTVVTPDKWQKTFKTDEKGQLTVPVEKTGRFVLYTHHEETGIKREIAGKQVSTLSHIASLSFMAE